MITLHALNISRQYIASSRFITSVRHRAFSPLYLLLWTCLNIINRLHRYTSRGCRPLHTDQTWPRPLRAHAPANTLDEIPHNSRLTPRWNVANAQRPAFSTVGTLLCIRTQTPGPGDETLCVGGKDRRCGRQTSSIGRVLRGIVRFGRYNFHFHMPPAASIFI